MGQYLQNRGMVDKSEEARIREDMGLGSKSPTCKQMYDRILEKAPEFLPQQSVQSVQKTEKMHRTWRTTLVKAYLKWLDSREPAPIAVDEMTTSQSGDPENIQS